jgi:hypothetical protein
MAQFQVKPNDYRRTNGRSVIPLRLTQAMVPPVKIIFNDKFNVDIHTACRIEFLFPVKLPCLLDPSIPPAPYYPPHNQVDSHWVPTMAVLRPIMASALYELLGPDAPIAEMVGNDTDSTLSECWEGKVITHRANYNLATGYWKDQRGEEGYGIDAYFQYLDGGISVLQAWKFGTQYRVAHDSNPLFLKLKAEDNLEDGMVIFHASKYPEHMRRYKNDHINEYGSWM